MKFIVYARDQATNKVVSPFAVEAGSQAEAKLAAVERGLTVDSVKSVADLSRSASLLKRGGAYYEQGELTRAIADFTSSLQLWPSWQAYFERGRAYVVKRQYQKAVADLTEMLGREPVDRRRIGEAYFYRSKAHRKLKKLSEALADCTRAIELLPKHFDALVERAKIHRAMGDEASALRDARAAKELRREFEHNADEAPMPARSDQRKPGPAKTPIGKSPSALRVAGKEDDVLDEADVAELAPSTAGGDEVLDEADVAER